MKTKYNNDSIIGGKNITASYTKNGELLRVMYPFPDFRSWIDEFKTGVKINDVKLDFFSISFYYYFFSNFFWNFN